MTIRTLVLCALFGVNMIHLVSACEKRRNKISEAVEKEITCHKFANIMNNSLKSGPTNRTSPTRRSSPKKKPNVKARKRSGSIHQKATPVNPRVLEKRMKRAERLLECSNIKTEWNNMKSRWGNDKNCQTIEIKKGNFRWFYGKPGVDNKTRGYPTATFKIVIAGGECKLVYVLDTDPENATNPHRFKLKHNAIEAVKPIKMNGYTYLESQGKGNDLPTYLRLPFYIGDTIAAIVKEAKEISPWKRQQLFRRQRKIVRLNNKSTRQSIGIVD